MTKYFWILLIVINPWVNLVWAFEDDVLGDGTGEDFGFIPKRSWQEADIALPPVPLESGLISLKVFEMPHYRYYIDQQSVNVSPKDNVVRYTIVIEPPGGLRNVFYEGIRCDTNQHKTYASALWGQPLSAITDPEWESIADKGINVYRHDLYEYFLCHNSIIKSDKKDIIQALKYPPDNFIEDELE